MIPGRADMNGAPPWPHLPSSASRAREPEALIAILAERAPDRVVRRERRHRRGRAGRQRVALRIPRAPPLAVGATELLLQPLLEAPRDPGHGEQARVHVVAMA